MFPTIRKSIGPNLKALICGSAPLAVETQLFFMMLGIPVLQVYGLTETTAICTMDDPQPRRARARGPGDSGHRNEGRARTAKFWCAGRIFSRLLAAARGNREGARRRLVPHRRSGRSGRRAAIGASRPLKNLIILNSGHNVAPEPLEAGARARLPEAQQVVLVGNQRSFLAALVTTAAANGTRNGVTSQVTCNPPIDALNASLPHYKQIRAFHVVPEPFSVENGLLTANGKLKRDAIAARFAAEIEKLYQKKPA